MHVAFGTDQTGPLSEILKAGLVQRGHHVVAVADPAPWPEVGAAVAISLRLTSPAIAEELLDAFFGTDPDPDEMDTINRLDASL